MCCTVCVGVLVALVRSGKISVGDEYSECMDEFCYVGDMINAGGGTEAN